MTYDKRGTHEGYRRGEIYFVDASVLHVREIADVETTGERLLDVSQEQILTSETIARRQHWPAPEAQPPYLSSP